MPRGTIDSDCDYVTELAHRRGGGWPTIRRAQEQADEVLRLLTVGLKEFASEDIDIVVFGSLARREWTGGSDVDWTLLVDGQVDYEHRGAAREVNRKLHESHFQGRDLKPPGSEGIFGSLTFSHELVHHIGGQADTNRNTTQRVLLLLESTALTPREPDGIGPHKRVVRQVLSRYLANDFSIRAHPDSESRIPRFLLNDIVRYWRTMCVDFAYKDWEQAGQKWALRNIKLRMSRKMLFLSGLLTVFSCYRNVDILRPDSADQNNLFDVQRHLTAFARSTPLNIVVWMLHTIGLAADCVELLDAYEQFLDQMNDDELRDRLKNLTADDAFADEIYLRCRATSDLLQCVVRRLCFERDSELREFIREYGVF